MSCHEAGDAGESIMKTCVQCRTENADAAQYCDECGASLGAVATVKPPPTFLLPSPPAVETKGSVGENGSGARRESPVVEVSGASRLTTGGVSLPRPASAASSPIESGLSAHAKLTINRGRAAGKVFPLHEEEIYLGRWDADSGIFPDVDLDADDPDAKISRRHARITRRGTQYFIEDLGSTNGTFINRGRRLLTGDRQLLHDGDEIIVGKTFLRFQVVG